jgi:hypothetical protein
MRLPDNLPRGGKKSPTEAGLRRTLATTGYIELILL